MTATRLAANMPLLPVDDWRGTTGETVEIRFRNGAARRGQVDETMPDGTGLWLAAHGESSRVYIHKEDATGLWVRFEPGS